MVFEIVRLEVLNPTHAISDTKSIEFDQVAVAVRLTDHEFILDTNKSRVVFESALKP